MSIIKIIDSTINKNDFSSQYNANIEPAKNASIKSIVSKHLLESATAGVVGGCIYFALGTVVEKISASAGYEWVDGARNEWLTELYEQDWFEEAIKSPFFEELEYRLLWQTGITLAVMVFLNKSKSDKKINILGLAQIKLSILVGVVASSIIFAKDHYSDTAQNPYVFVFMVFLGGLIYSSLNVRYGLIACTIAHIAHNKLCDFAD